MVYRQTEKVRARLAARKAAILAAARALAAEQGLEAVQIAPVADRAGIAAGTVYRYFPAKTVLVEALVESVTRGEVEAIRAAAETAPGPLSSLSAAILTLAARARRQRRLIWSLTGEPADVETDSARLRFRAALVDELAVRLGPAVTSLDAPLAATTVLGALLEGLVGPLAPPVGAGERDTVQTVVLIALRGLGIVDARARGLVVQAPWPVEEPAPA
ncbi:MAG TPA: TetR/AcrR family transcriptional regulator [Xanthobacteraceae bacterium]|nr:TetR/AcrR family transcriptional regulator [Xanthobacteraceae bacterium]